MRTLLNIVCLIMAASPLAVTAAAHRQNNDARVARGIDRTCDGTTLHEVAYDTVMGAGVALVHMDDMPIKSVTCDLDHTQMFVEMRHRTEAIEWLAKFHDFTGHILVGGSKYNCSAIPASADMVLRRIYATSESKHLGNTLHIRTSMVRYDEIYESANIDYRTYHNHPHCNSSSKNDICLNYNVDCDGTQAKQVFPIIDTQYLTATCSDCFAKIEADVKASLHIQDFTLHEAKIGLENIQFNATSVVSVSAHAQWSSSFQENLPILAPTKLLEFNVGIIPFCLVLSMPMVATGAFSFDAEANLDVGVTGGVSFGALELSYDQTNHFHVTTPTAVPSWQPVLRKSAKLNGSAMVALAPKVQISFARVLTYELDMNPEFDAGLAYVPEKQQICVDASIQASITQQAELEINVPLLNIHKDYKYGPESLYQHVWTMPEKCFGV